MSLALELPASSIRRTDRRVASRLGWVAYTWSFALPVAATIFALVRGSPVWLMPAFAVLTALGLVMLLRALMLIVRSGRPGHVECRDGTLTLFVDERAQHIPLEQITSGIAIENEGASSVELVTDWGETIQIDFDSATSAQSLLSALGIDDRARVTIVRVGTRYPASVVVTATTAMWVVFGIILLNVLGPMFGFNLIRALTLTGIVGAAFGAGWLWSSTDVVVGRDGIRLRHFLTRFIPFDSIRDVELAPAPDDRVRIVTHDGETLHVHPIATGHPERMRALLHCIERARVTDEGRGIAAIHALDRRGERIAEWRARLRHLFEAQPGYRGARIEVDDAVAIVSDAARAPAHRLGAALALSDGGALDHAARAQLRIAAEGMANPKLRVAFEALADGSIDDATIEAVLAMHETETSRPLSRRHR